MKLAIGPYKDLSGYAALARNYTRALFLVDNQEDWALAATRYDSGSQTQQLPELLRGLKRKISKDVKVTVQFVTPNEMRPAPNRFNIGICCWETDKIPPHWAIQLNSFDVIVVPCEANKIAFEKSGVSKPIHVIPLPAFKEDYTLENIPSFEIPNIDAETTIYYNISQWTHKKGIDALLRSYFLAFQNNEKVLLVLKGYVGMMSQQGDAQKLLSTINEIKAVMRLPRYPAVYITDNVMSDHGIKQLHKLGDCYVNMSRGEGWAIPAFESLLYGNELITTTHTAMAEWATSENCWPVESYLDSVHNMPHPDPSLYTARENWYEPVIISGANAFKKHFTLMKKNNQEQQDKLYAKFDPKVIGQKLKDLINV